MTAILQCRALSYRYGDGTPALENVSLDLEEGRKVALVGPNGAGKSTLMLMFNGILRPSQGQVLFRGEALGYDASSLRDIRRAVGMVFQNSDDQLFAPSVYQDVAFGPANLGYAAEKVKRYAGFALQYVGLAGYERRPPHHLSGGEKKRVAIAGILAMEPEVMILDEPTSNLDPASSEEIMDMLDELNCGGKTMIISTHDVDLAYRWADDVVLMMDGRVAKRGSGPEVFTDAGLIRQARLKPPLVVEIYRQLAARDLVDGSRPPAGVLELCGLLEKRWSGPADDKRMGRICILSVDEGEPGRAEMNAALQDAAADCIGAMGSSAKILAEECGINLDFTYGVIDKCILKALAGRDCLILTSGGMVQHAQKRIGEYCRDLGREISVQRLSAPGQTTKSLK